MMDLKGSGDFAMLDLATADVQTLKAIAAREIKAETKIQMPEQGFEDFVKSLNYFIEMALEVMELDREQILEQIKQLRQIPGGQEREENLKVTLEIGINVLHGYACLLRELAERVQAIDAQIRLEAMGESVPAQKPKAH